MSGSPQNPRARLDTAFVKGLPNWSPRPIWEGLAIAVLAIGTTIYATVVVGREQATRAPVAAMREGLELLVVERDVSIVAFDLIATLSMEMYEGGHEADLERRRIALRTSVEAARSRLAATSPTDAWRQTHDGMSEAVSSALGTFDEERTHNELYSWLSEFLYDFKLVIPTDNMGRWSALLEVATWSQEIPLIVQDYLDIGMAREWQRTGRTPADPDLLESYNISLASMRQIRESHGARAADYTLYEEYLLLERAEDADPTAVELTRRLAHHPGVARIEAAMPYLLGLTDDPQVASISEIYALREAWVPELTDMVEDLRLHALVELDAALSASFGRRRIARWGGILAILIGIAAAVRLILSRVRVDTQLRSALERDTLTGLANRFALFSSAPGCLVDPTLRNFALIHVDLDDFKSINDEYGHHIGDQALVAFATALKTAVRWETDLVCRVGGDEFVVLLHKLDDPEAAAQAVVERLRRELETPIQLDRVSLRLHFTAGIAIAREEVALEELLIEADLALLAAKERGRDAAQFFRRKLGRRMIHELSTALGAGELGCAFQPQVDMESGTIVGLEALARWEREDRLQVPTRSLIDALEWLGASRDWLRVAMRDIELAWRIAGDRVDGRIWLNLMACDIEDAEADELLEILDGTSVPLRRIGLEITEAVGRSKIDRVTALLEQLREAGLSIALDDVGDDRIPLLHVTELPIDLVKLDRCLIMGIDSQRPLRAVVESLAGLCDRLDLRILAEGVETVEEQAVLRRLGIRYVQGSLFALPLSLSALDGYLEAPMVRGAAANVA